MSSLQKVNIPDPQISGDIWQRIQLIFSKNTLFLLNKNAAGYPAFRIAGYPASQIPVSGKSQYPVHPKSSLHLIILIGVVTCVQVLEKHFKDGGTGWTLLQDNLLLLALTPLGVHQHHLNITGNINIGTKPNFAF